MWKKRIFYCLIVLGLTRLGLSLYSMIPPVFSQGSCTPKAYFVSTENYDQEFKKALERDVDNIVDDAGIGSISELDVYIGLLLTEKEKKHPGFTERNKETIERLRAAVIEYVRTYSTFWNQKWSDVGPKSGKREIQSCISKSGNEVVKPLLDKLMYTEEEEVS